MDEDENENKEVGKERKKGEVVGERGREREVMYEKKGRRGEKISLPFTLPFVHTYLPVSPHTPPPLLLPPPPDH